MDRIGAEVQAGALTLFQHPFHPQGEPGLFARAFCDCWGYRSTHADFSGCGITDHFRRLMELIPALNEADNLRNQHAAGDLRAILKLRNCSHRTPAAKANSISDLRYACEGIP